LVQAAVAGDILQVITLPAANLSNAVNNTLFTTKGDIVAATGPNIVSRLGVGTDGQLLTANSASATGIAWLPAPVSLPTQTSNAGYMLVTNGTAASWTNIITANAIGTISLIARGLSGQTAALQQWQTNTGSAVASMSASGAFSAVTKSFEIDHPTKSGMRLRYASLEGPENGVYVRGTTTEFIIELPDYWTGLVDSKSITVNLTPVGKSQNIYVEKIENNKVYIGGELEKAFFTVYGERKDVDKLLVEF
jgi:hypothetical protein